MKLYYYPGACSLSPHIILQEAGLTYSLEKVDLKTHTTSDGGDFFAINPKGYVPVLQLDDGSLLTEGMVITQYLADQVPEKKLVPMAGTMERYHLMETQTFISTELHKNFSPLFTPNSSNESKEAALKALKPRFALIAKQLDNADYLGGNQFTIADAYLFVMLLWATSLKIPMAEHRNLQAFQTRVASRPAVRAAMISEGLIKIEPKT